VSAFNTRIPIGGINLNPRSTHLDNITESVLVESRSARTSQLSDLSNERALETLNKAKALVMALWQGTGVATNKQLAEYYEISEEAVQQVYYRHKEECAQNGAKVLKGNTLREVVDKLSTRHNGVSSLTIWTPRAALGLGMLLQNSPVARKVRSVILDIVEEASPSPKPPDNPFDLLGSAITDAVAKLVQAELAKHQPPTEPVDIDQPRAELPPSIVKLIDKREKTKQAYVALIEIRDQWCKSRKFSTQLIADCSFLVAVKNGEIPEVKSLLPFLRWGSFSGISRATLCRARKRIKDGETFRKDPWAERDR
jgi:hypothetical protein